MAFCVKAAIAGQGFEGVPIVRLPGHLVEAWIVRRGPHSRYDRKAQVLGHVDDRPKLREFMALSTATLTEVGGDMARFQARGIDGRQLRLLADQPVVAGFCNQRVKQGRDAIFFNSRFSA